MKRTRTIASYFSRVAEQEHQTIHPLSPPPPDPEQEQGSIQPPPAPSQGAEQESVSTRASAVDVDLSQPIVELDQTSLPAAAVELSQPPAEETSNENANFVEEGDSNHVLGPEDIVADPALRKPIEEMHPNIRDDETL